MPGLRESIFGDGLRIDFEMRFYRGAQRRSFVSGMLRGEFVVQCQRCLGPLVVPVDEHMALAVVKVIAEIDRLPEGCEPLLVEGRSLRPIQLLEDEIRLLIPMVPRHEVNRCHSPASVGDVASTDEEQEEQGARHPFAALAELKRRDS